MGGRCIIQHSSYGQLIIIGTDHVHKDYSAEQDLIDEVRELRRDLLGIVREHEHSDMPMKTFRIHSLIDYENTLHVIIKTRTRLGAIIAFADRDMKRIESDPSFDNLKGLSLWFELVGEKRDDIREYAKSMSERMIFLREDEVEDEVITFSE